VPRHDIEGELSMNATARCIWIDLDNSPHVPFFRPIVDELRQGFTVAVTARDAFNVAELVRLHRIEATTIGRHYGKHKAMKVLGLGVRAMQLLPYAARHRPCLALSHGSRSQTLAARLAGIPSMIIADYEHVTHLTRPDWMIFPEVIPEDITRRLSRRVLRYPGIKEDVYTAAFVPDPALASELGLTTSDVVATVRPPATEAHYHHVESDELFAAAMERLLADARIRVVMLPRSERQKVDMAARFGSAIDSGRIIVLTRAVDGLNLVWLSDLVISGGGTMNREAAALGVPVYSTFRGPTGAVDRWLASQGRLTLLESAADVRARLVLAKRDRSRPPPSAGRAALEAIVAHIARVAGPRSVATTVLKTGDA
jgi:predicted glycosyltransferase